MRWLNVVLLSIVVGACSRAPKPSGRDVREAPGSSAAAAQPAAPVVTTPASAAPAVATAGTDDCPVGWTCDARLFDAQPRPAITQVLIQKSAHRLHLIAEKTIIKTYRVALGSGGLGQKRYEGDRVTPIGRYTITGKYPSRWHTYLALDYPNPDDRARHADASSRGEIPEGRGPGSGIAIHGRKATHPDGVHKLIDWTLGCVALDNPEIDEVASVAPIGTPVVIGP